MKFSKALQLVITVIILLAVPFTVMVSRTAEDPRSNASVYTTPFIIPTRQPTPIPTVAPSCITHGGSCVLPNFCHLNCRSCSSYYTCQTGTICCL